MPKILFEFSLPKKSRFFKNYGHLSKAITCNLLLFSILIICFNSGVLGVLKSLKNAKYVPREGVFAEL